MFKTIKNNQISAKYFAFGLIIIFSVLFFKAQNVSAGYVTFYQPPIFESDNNYEDEYNIPLNPTPYISFITPNNIPKGADVYNVTITGNGFTSTSVVRINNAPRTASYVNSTRMIIQLEEKDIKNVKNHTISVLNGTPGGGISNSAILYITPATNANQNFSGSINPNSNNNTSNTNTSTSQNSNSNFNSTSYDSTTSRNDSNLSANALSSFYNSRNTDNSSYKGLTSNAVFGSNSFLPSGILQWFIFIVLVIAIIFIWRKFFGAEKYYRSIPLKHA
ncbi:MAG: hypothetical protein K9L98_03230 [Candidatus Pacebacteria bacterium]|nr:hypothetical protein [Candidatus Paceibacterota bacterium]MCF7862994.1 hypothetical protein [Candidatus Paceibacterota bacterium]